MGLISPEKRREGDALKMIFRVGRLLMHRTRRNWPEIACMRFKLEIKRDSDRGCETAECVTDRSCGIFCAGGLQKLNRFPSVWDDLNVTMPERRGDGADDVLGWHLGLWS